MLDLLIIMFERVGMIVAVAFLLTRFRFFQHMIHQDVLDRRQELTAILFFGLFGIFGTYFGVALDMQTFHFENMSWQLATDEAIANSRVIGVVVAGLLGGYRLGIGAGLIAGIHRMSLGGFTAISCGVSTIISGILAGYFYKKGKRIRPLLAFTIGAAAEALQMLLIVVMAQPFEKAFALVQTIGVPMILANGMGTALFMLIAYNVISDQEKVTALQAQKTLRIADQTLGYLRTGMRKDTAEAVCGILLDELKPGAVAMTNKTDILAYVGSKGTIRQGLIQTDITRQVIREGQLIVTDSATPDHPGISASEAIVIAPLKTRGETIGTLKLFYPSRTAITDVTIELIAGLAALLSNQLEIAEADDAYQLAKEAEIQALQAQISPHFLFNSMNIILSLIRTNPDEARKLLSSLSFFLRQNLEGTTAKMVTLQQELAHVEAYLMIEEARFIDKLKICIDVDPHVMQEKIPPLTLQPIVENAMTHGIKDLDANAMVHISIHERDNAIHIMVQDNGEGIVPARLAMLGQEPVRSEKGTGLGLYNVNRRLKMTFDKNSGLTIKSTPNEGTKISFQIPKSEVNEYDGNDSRIGRR
ncbi:sensor histidine kinase [Sporosarcina sp. P21c]|uniref:sensor histidine kinase n=1 Tax=unclassified Sporosarcina TaxID=2647733 RepID=UPI000C170077|nr:MULTISPECIES: sensor histidine kinase [unclassified Sporosarcina]PIC67116.1 sensor histidine kinase [Sporosarcina sp. P16a]PIC82764.1 sensor histidine kinase [Sporosarcina sp. P1]PIC89591.1 sensor histidine kinase [Sporosarcina sp. P21c]PIC92568.1 sensor histidine kinase [Sporosarcina sp. P25]